MPTSQRQRVRREPKQVRSKKMVRWILDAATQVFERHGYAAGTTNHIAERAGVSIGSLYQYFPNKDAILLALAEAHLEEGRRFARRALEEAHTTNLPLETLLRVMVEGFVDLHASNPNLHRLLFEEAPLPATVWQAFDAALKELAEGVATLLSTRSDLDVSNLHLTAHLLVHTVEGLTHKLVLHPPEHFTRPQLVDEVVVMLREYLLPSANVYL